MKNKFASIILVFLVIIFCGFSYKIFVTDVPSNIVLYVSNEPLNSKITSIRTSSQSIEINVNPRKTPLYNENDKVVYLTFDDGPSQNTLRILSILKEKNIKGTFFVNYHPNCDNIYKKIHEDGHAIGNHTYSHAFSRIYQSEASFFEDYDKLNNYLQETLGFTPNIMRFPGGSNTSYGKNGIMKSLVAAVKARGIEYYDWNSLTGDAEGQAITKNQLIDKVKATSHKKNSLIVLMHDSSVKQSTPEALPEIIDYFKSQGYIFAPLSNGGFSIHYTK